MVFMPSAGVVTGSRETDGATEACRCSAVEPGCIPTMVAFFAVMGRICGGFARGRPEPTGRDAGCMLRDVGPVIGGGAATGTGFRTLTGPGTGAVATGRRDVDAWSGEGGLVMPDSTGI